MPILSGTLTRPTYRDVGNADLVGNIDRPTYKDRPTYLQLDGADFT
jgi:hypothetical protein